MKFLWRTAIISIVVLALLTGALGSIRWARRGGTAAGFAANALLLRREWRPAGSWVAARLPGVS